MHAIFAQRTRPACQTQLCLCCTQAAQTVAFDCRLEYGVMGDKEPALTTLVSKTQGGSSFKSASIQPPSHKQVRLSYLWCCPSASCIQRSSASQRKASLASCDDCCRRKVESSHTACRMFLGKTPLLQLLGCQHGVVNH